MIEVVWKLKNEDSKLSQALVEASNNTCEISMAHMTMSAFFKS